MNDLLPPNLKARLTVNASFVAFVRGLNSTDDPGPDNIYKMSENQAMFFLQLGV